VGVLGQRRRNGYPLALLGELIIGTNGLPRREEVPVGPHEFGQDRRVVGRDQTAGRHRIILAAGG
jgi:hypothetical protein